MESMNENRTNNDKQATSTPTDQGGQSGQANAGSAAPTNGADDMLKLMGENQKTCC